MMNLKMKKIGYIYIYFVLVCQTSKVQARLSPTTTTAAPTTTTTAAPTTTTTTATDTTTDVFMNDDQNSKCRDQLAAWCYSNKVCNYPGRQQKGTRFPSSRSADQNGYCTDTGSGAFYYQGNFYSCFKVSEYPYTDTDGYIRLDSRPWKDGQCCFISINGNVDENRCHIPPLVEGSITQCDTSTSFLTGRPKNQWDSTLNLCRPYTT